MDSFRATTTASSPAEVAHRLYNTAVGHTRADRQAAYDSYNVAPPTPVSALAAANPGAASIARLQDGPLIVTYVRAACSSPAPQRARPPAPSSARGPSAPCPPPPPPHPHPACHAPAPARAQPTPRKTDNQKAETLLTPRGKCRTPFGGFYAS